MGIVPLADSLMETVNGGSPNEYPRSSGMLQQLQAALNTPDRQVEVVPLQWDNGEAANPVNNQLPFSKLTPSVVHTNGSLDYGGFWAWGGKNVFASDGHAVAVYFPRGLNHAAFLLQPSIAIAASDTSSFDAYVYAGDVRSTIPAAGAGSPLARVHSEAGQTLISGGAAFQASSLVSGANAQRDSGGTAQGNAGSVIVVIGENGDYGVNSGQGCTVVLREGSLNGAQGSLFGMVIGMRGGAGFSAGFTAVYPQAISNLVANFYTEPAAVGANEPTYYGGTKGDARFGIAALRLLEKYQPYSVGASSIPVNFGRSAALDKLIVIDALFANRFSPNFWGSDVVGFTALTPAQINAEMDAKMALADKVHSEGGVYIGLELGPINESPSDYELYMSSWESRTINHQAGVWLSFPQSEARRRGITAQQVRKRSDYQKVVGPAPLATYSGATNHMGISGMDWQAQMIANAFLTLRSS